MKNLKYLREARGFTQQKLADILNLSQQTIHKYEHDLAEPDFSTLKSMAELFHTSIDFLLDFDIDDNSYIIRESDETLTPEEIHYLNMYRKVSDDLQGSINHILEGLCATKKEEADQPDD